jgi:hypothetical protein
VKIDLAFHPIPGAIVGKPGDIYLADSPDTKLEGIALPHAVNVTTLKSFAGFLGFGFYTNEKSVPFEDPVNGSPGTG